MQKICPKSPCSGHASFLRFRLRGDATSCLVLYQMGRCEEF